MAKVKIHIIKLGGIKHNLDFEKIQKWRTSFFEIPSYIETIEALPNSILNTGEDGDPYYTDDQIRSIIGNTSQHQMVFALINQPTESNFYARIITKNCLLFSLYETAEIVLKNDFKIEHYIIQNLYLTASFYYRYINKSPTDLTDFIHQDIRGCLFDFNVHKEDLIFSLGNHTVCNTCKGKFDNSIVPLNFVDNIKCELKKIKKPLYYRLRDFIREEPIWSILIGAFFTLALNFLASYIFYLLFSRSK